MNRQEANSKNQVPRTKFLRPVCDSEFDSWNLVFAALTRRWLVALAGFTCVLSGCLYNARERADEVVCSLAMQPYDRQLVTRAEAQPKTPSPSSGKKSEGPSFAPLHVQTTELTTPGANVNRLAAPNPDPTHLVYEIEQPAEKKPRLEPPIPPEVPGSETPRLPGKASPEELQQIYLDLPPLPEEPVAQPGPDGKHYTLSA